MNQDNQQNFQLDNKDTSKIAKILINFRKENETEKQKLDPKSKDEFVIETLVLFLDLFSKIEDIIENSLFLLQKLIITENENQKENQTLKGIDLILKSMINFPDNKEIQRQACSLLSVLSLDEQNKIEIKNLNGVELIQKVISKFPDDQILINSASKTLSNISIDNSKEKKELESLKKEYETSQTVFHFPKIQTKKKKKESTIYSSSQIYIIFFLLLLLFYLIHFLNNLEEDKGSLIHFLATKQPINFGLLKNLSEDSQVLNQQDWSPVHYLCQNESITFEIIDFLVKKGANFNLSGRVIISLINKMIIHFFFN
ncbi:hypothetical protein M0811_08335 [Anaeramoeba ignava]|uniref:Ankyrin repeat protein n=1 Tax=Anaeramoeba ignava TaxID=1746090 RepID=A0A9Q0LJF3_ANAIG|nr:hypothetical protein M0811_08335 [Anaeramoeba ignava]